jgi:protein dithiol:quinone oxidoreductase
MRIACHSGEKRIVKWPSHLRIFFAVGFIVPCALVALAVVLTVRYQVAACPLCIVQRMLYLCIALASLFGLAFASLRGARVGATWVILITAANGAMIAGYQIYLQRHPFSASCGDGTAWWERVVDRAGQDFPLLFKADGLCSDSTWSLFGISMPEWSTVVFASLFALGLLALFSGQKR